MKFKTVEGVVYSRVLHDNQIKSLPYSMKFKTVEGVVYSRVLHDKPN